MKPREGRASGWGPAEFKLLRQGINEAEKSSLGLANFTPTGVVKWMVG